MVKGANAAPSGGGAREIWTSRRWQGFALLALTVALTAGLVYVEIARAAITVTPASGGTGISVDTAADAATPSYTALGNIVLSEGANGDFASSANQKLELQPPAGWEFNPASGSTSHQNGRNITADSISVAASLATVTVSVSGTNKLDTLTISGLQVRPASGTGCGTNPCKSGNITRTGSGTDTFAASVGTGTNFGSLSAIPGAATKLGLSGASSSTAGQNSASITATIQDQFGNAATLGTDTVVTPSSSSTSGTKAFKTTGGTTQATFTITAGTSTVSFLYYDETAGSYSITLTNDASLTNPAAYGFTVNADAATKLTIAGASSSTAGQNSASITVTIQDAFGNSATRGSDTVVTPSSSSTSGTKAFKTTGGATQATFTITAGSSTVSFLSYDETAGSYSITLTNDASLTNPAAYGFTVSAAAATKLALSGAGSSTAGQNSASITATIQDQFGNAATLGTDTVVTPSSSSTSGTKAFKTTGGTTQATFTITAGTSTVSFLYYDETAGSYSITLSNDASLTNPSAYGFTVNAAAATKLTIAGASSSTAGQNSASITVSLRDQFDNAATRGTDTVVTPSSSSTSGTKAFKTTGGATQASFTITAGSSTVSFLYYDETAGSYSITLANDASLTNPAGHGFTVDADAASNLALTGPSSVTAGQDSTLFTVTIQDAFGNSATRGSDTVVTPASSSSSSTKAFKTAGGTTQATFTIGAGTSTVQFRYYDETAGSYTITLANDASLTEPAGHALAVDPAAATKIALTGPASVTAGQDSGLFTATIQDAFGNSTTRGSDTVVTPASSSSSSTKAFKTAGGATQATFTVTAGTSTVQFRYYDETTGSYSITLANDASLTNPAGHALTVDPAAASKLAITSVAGGSNPVAAVAFAVVVRSQDAFGNFSAVAANTDVTLSVATGTGTLGGTVTGTLGAGSSSATISGVTYDTPESGVSLTATRTAGDALAAGTSATFTVDPGAVALAITAPTSASALTAGAFSVTVESQDGSGNAALVAADTGVALSLGAGSGPLGGTLTGTIAAGTSSVTIVGATYTKAESGVVLTATRTSGDTLTPGDSDSLTFGPGPLHHFAVTNTSGGAIGTQTAGVAFDVEVVAQDAYDNTVTGFGGTVDVSSNKACSAGCTTSAGFVGGELASHSVTLTEAAAGTAHVIATKTSAGETGSSNDFTVAAAAASKLTLTGPGTVTAGQDSALFTATLRDQFDNAATRGSDTVVTPASSSGSGLFKTAGGTTQATFTIGAGSSSVTFRAYDETTGSYTITLANDASLTNPAGHALTVDPAAAGKLALSGPATVTAGVDSALFTATIQDAFGNATTRGSDTTITPAGDSGTGSFTAQPSYTITAGQTSTQFTYNDETAGSYTITLGNDASLTDPAGHALTVDPAAATKISVAGPATVTAGQDSALFTATLRDQFDNAATRGSDTVVTPDSSSSSESFKTAGGATQASFTIGAGSSSVQFRAYDETAGSYSITLSNDGSLTNPAAHGFTVDPAAAGAVVLSGATSTVAGEDSGLITAALEDAFGNTATRGSDTVLTPSSTSGSATKAFKTTGGATQATFTIGAGSSSVSFRYYDETGGSYDLGLANDASLADPAVYAFQVYAAHGSGALTAGPTSVSASQTGRTITLTYTAASGGTNDGAVRVTVPSGWSPPSTTASAAGYTTASAGTVGVSGQELTVSGVTLAGGATLTITYGDTAGGGPGATAPASTGAQTWDAEQRSTAAGTLTALAGSPTVTVHAADGSGTLTADTAVVAASQSGRTIVFTYTAATGGLSDGAVRVTVPTGWTGPAGITSASTGTVGTSGQEITVTGVTLAGGATMTITYGVGGTATATSSAGTQSWQGAERSTAGGSLANLAASPSITVYAADGSGAISVSPTNVLAASSGNTITLTYTAAGGGMSDGAVRVTVPAGWTAPAGITSASTGTVGTSGQLITVTGVTLAGSATLTITYGVGGTAAAPGTPGSAEWTTDQRSISGSTPTALAAQPSVTVEAIDGAGTTTVSPGSVSAGSPQTLTFTYTAGAAGMADGAVTVAVPADWPAPAGIVSASTGTVGTSGQLITVSGVTLAASATMTITYGPATATSTTGAQTWTVQQRGTTGGTLVDLTSGSPAVTVYAADGTGSIVSDTSYVVNGSTGNTIELTYTAAPLAGGMSGGEVEVTVPGNWAAPNPVDVVASTGTVGVSGNVVTVTGITLAQGADLTITYSNAPAPTTGGAQTWTTRQSSTAAGALTGIASPSIVVSSTPAVPTLVTPADGALVTATPTLTATFADADAADTGTITFQVCDDAACTSVADQFDSPTTLANGANGSAGASGLSEGVTYHWRAQATDSDNVTSAYSATRSFTVDGTGPTIASVDVTEGGADSHASGSTLFYRPSGAGGTFTVAVDASDPAGVDHVTFPGLASGFTPTTSSDDDTAPYSQTYTWNTGDSEAGSKSVTAVDELGNTAGGTFTITADPTAPAGGSISVPGYSSSTTVTITSGNFADAGSGISANTITRSEADLSGPGSCGAYGSTVVVTSPDTVPADGKCYRYTLTGTDNVGNTATVSDEVLVDTTPPSAPALTLSESAGNLHADGTTLWFNGGAAGGDFTVAAATSDAQSGIAKVAFPAVGSAGAADDATAPYERTYSWTGAEQLANGVVAHNNAGGTAATPFDVVEDSTVPTGGSISVPAYSSSTTVAITSTDYADAGAGIAANTITRSDGQDPASPGTCPAGGYTGATTVTSPDTVPADGKCYRYTLTGTDNVGNEAAATDDVLVDTTAPAQPALTVSTGSTGVYADNAAAPQTVWFKPGTAAGDFTVNATTSDDESGVEHVQFGAVAGLTGHGGDTTEPYQRTYSWTSAPASGAGAVSAFNNAGLESAATTFDLTADGTAPTGGSISVPAYSSSTTVAITSTDYADAGAGIAANTITRSDGQDPASPGTCPAGGYTGATTVTSPDTVPADGKCYRYTLTGTDNVGNVAAISATVLVDTTPPTGPGLTLSTASAGVYAVDATRTVWFKPDTATGGFTVTATTSDAQSDVDKVSFPAIAGLTGGGDATPPGPFPLSYSWTSAPSSSVGNSVTAFNRAGGTSANTFDLASDGAGPSGGSVGYPDGVQSDGAPDVTVTLPADTESGLATVTLQQVFWGASCAAAGSPVDLQTVSANGAYNVILDQGFGCYTFQLRAVDNVGNVSTITSASSYHLSGGTSLEIVELTSGEHQHFAGGNLYLNTVLATDGTFRIKVADAVAPDVDSVDFPAVSSTGLSGDALSDSGAPFESDEYTWTNAFTSSGTIAITLHLSAGAGGGTRTELIQPLVDTTAPAVSDDTGTIGGGWKNSAQTVTLSAGDSGGSGVEAVHYTTDGSTPTSGSPSGTAVPLNASGVYTVSYFAVDNVGNTSSAQTASTQVRVDLDDPSNALAVTSVAPGGTAYVNGTDVWYQGGTAGSFALSNGVADGHSGPASTTFPAFAQADWTAKGAETPTTPAGGPYESSAFTRAAAAGGSFAYAVTGTDAAGNGTSTTLTFRADTTAPVTGDDYASIGGAWHKDPQTLTLSPADGAGSGVGATFYSLDGGTTWTQGAAVTLSATGTYNVTLYSVDNVGNAEAARTVGPIRIDATAPSNSVALFGASPAGSALLSGTTLYYRGAAAGSFRLRSTVGDADSGPAGTTFGDVSAANWTPKSAEPVSAPAGGPYESSAFGWNAGSADFPLTVTGTDGAGNGTDTVLTMVDDSTPPDVSDDTASITSAWRNTNATVTLTATDSASGVAAVYYSLDGGTTWTQGTTIPLTATGVHTIEYYAVDNVGNASAVETADSQIRIDKLAPSGAVTNPAPGATVSGTSTQLSATATDATSGVASVQFQVRPDGSLGAFSNAGLPVTMPPFDATWDSTTVASGDYELRAFVSDLAGNTFATGTRTITVDNAPASGPADTVIPAGTLTDTTLPVPGTLDTVTVPGGSNTETLVVRTEERIDLESTPPAGSTFGGAVVEVRACVAGTGVSTASLDACLATGGTALKHLPAAWKVSLPGTGFPASSSDGTGWAEIVTELTDPADAAGHEESYLAVGGGFDLYTKHLSFFTLLVPQAGAVGLSRPGLTGVVQYGVLKLRWTRSGGSAPVSYYRLLTDGAVASTSLGAMQTEELLGPFSPDDTRVFAIQAVDIRGRVSPVSNAVTSVPSLIGLTVGEARGALAGRGFTATLADPLAPATDVVVRQSPTAPAMATVGTRVDLVTAGGEGHAAFRLQVSNSLRVKLGLHTLNVRVALTEPARVSARLFSNKRLVRTKAGRLVRWETSYKPKRVGAGATIVSFRLPRGLTRPGAYTLLVNARSTTSRTLTQSLTPISVVRPAVRQIVITQPRIELPVTLDRPSVVKVELLGTGKLAPWRKTWAGHHQLEAGTTILSLPRPRTLRKPGNYRFVLTNRVVATGKVTRTVTPVKVVKKRPVERKPVDVVVLMGSDVTPETPIAADPGVAISHADDADQVFTTASTPATNVQVIVVDVGGEADVELIRQLQLVYPGLKIVAVVPQGLGAAAREAGATIVVVKPAPAALISSIINRLAADG